MIVESLYGQAITLGGIFNTKLLLFLRYNLCITHHIKLDNLSDQCQGHGLIKWKLDRAFSLFVL